MYLATTAMGNASIMLVQLREAGVFSPASSRRLTTYEIAKKRGLLRNSKLKIAVFCCYRNVATVSKITIFFQLFPVFATCTVIGTKSRQN